MGVSIGVGFYVRKLVNDAILDTDDYLGDFTRSVLFDWGSNWLSGGNQGAPISFNNQEFGAIAAFSTTERMGAPRILNYSVEVTDLLLVEGYEQFSCHEPNEIFIQARTWLQENGGEIPDTRRFPTSGVWTLSSGDTLSQVPFIISGNNDFSVSNAPESPWIAIEVSVWDRDGGQDADLIGVFVDIVRLDDFFDEAADEVGPNGSLLRTASKWFGRTVRGFNGSDSDFLCQLNGPWDPMASQGEARLTYRVDAAWLKQMRR